jgi:KaiC/GvpD/RAD55 family RecA-like ATPase
VSNLNAHVVEYLTYYLGLPFPPNYAVLVNGAWGVGKTFLIKNYLKQNIHSERKFVYVSLYLLSQKG